MSRTIELPDAVYVALNDAARACGTTRIMTSERLRKCGRNIRA